MDQEVPADRDHFAPCRSCHLGNTPATIKPGIYSTHPDPYIQGHDQAENDPPACNFLPMINSIEHKDREIVYEIFGSGPAMMLVHGFGEDRLVWKNQVAALSNNFMLIMPDLSGSGESRIDHSTSSWSLVDHAESLLEILKQEKIESCLLIGHSMGGYISLAFAANWPGKLMGLGLFHSSVFADSPEKIKTRQKAIDFTREKGAATFLKTSIPNLFSEKFKKENPGFLEEWIAENSGFSEETLIEYYLAMIDRPDRSELLKNFLLPVLFIIGEEDNAVPLEASLKQAHFPLQSHVHILTKPAIWVCSKGREKQQLSSIVSGIIASKIPENFSLFLNHFHALMY